LPALTSGSFTCRIRETGAYAPCEAVFLGWGGPDQAAIGTITPNALDAMEFAAGSMGPKVAAACGFVQAGGTLAGIGRLQDARAIVEGRAGTQVRESDATDIKVRLTEKNVVPTLPC
jgi:hypothetical protein